MPLPFSTKRIALPKDIFNRAGLDLQLVHDKSGRAVNAFEGGRYDGSIFIETAPHPRNAVRINTTIETAEIIFIGSRDRVEEIMKTEQLTIANTIPSYWAIQTVYRLQAQSKFFACC